MCVSCLWVLTSNRINTKFYIALYSEFRQRAPPFFMKKKGKRTANDKLLFSCRFKVPTTQPPITTLPPLTTKASRFVTTQRSPRLSALIHNFSHNNTPATPSRPPNQVISIMSALIASTVITRRCKLSSGRPSHRRFLPCPNSSIRPNQFVASNLWDRTKLSLLSSSASPPTMRPSCRLRPTAGSFPHTRIRLARPWRARATTLHAAVVRRWTCASRSFCVTFPKACLIWNRRRQKPVSLPLRARRASAKEARTMTSAVTRLTKAKANKKFLK